MSEMSKLNIEEVTDFSVPQNDCFYKNKNLLENVCFGVESVISKSKYLPYSIINKRKIVSDYLLDFEELFEHVKISIFNVNTREVWDFIERPCILCELFIKETHFLPEKTKLDAFSCKINKGEDIFYCEFCGRLYHIHNNKDFS